MDLRLRRNALILPLLLSSLVTASPAFGQVRDNGDGTVVVAAFGGNNQFLDPYRFGIYCSSDHLLEVADPGISYPEWQANTRYRALMQDWMTVHRRPAGRRPDDFVIYLEAGTNFEVLSTPRHSDLEHAHYKIRVTSGPNKDRTCWTRYM